MKANSNKAKIKTLKQIEMEVLSVHNLFWEAYALRDIDLRFSLCSEDITFIGSGLHERAKNKTEYMKINKEGVKQFPDPFQIEFLWTRITMIDKNVASVESEVIWSQQINNETSKELLRNTTLIKYETNKWLVVHVHGSVPDYRLKEGDYMTNQQTLIRNKELEQQVFERTNDLKKSLEELEQKRKAIEAQGKIIQADNDRKTKELEEARQLQLSMLPKAIPSLPHLDIAVYMKTATEVGGDYYDFNVGLDGTLTVAIGDATGHGMKAGTIVSMVKALFDSNGSRLDMKSFLDQSSATLKGIKLGRLMMAFMMIKINANKLQISNAGMPPLYIYRKLKKEVEEIQINGMPLGAMKDFPYKIKEFDLLPGDTLLLLSDGFPELKNEKNEQYNYTRVSKAFKSAAEKKPEEIISSFMSEAESWSNNKEPDDDITFVVIKVK